MPRIRIIIAIIIVIALWVGMNIFSWSKDGIVAKKHSENFQATSTVAIPPKPKVPTVTILIGGDVMLDRHVRKLGMANGYDSLFTDLAPLFKKADVAVVNLEGPITSNSSKTLLKNGSTTKELIFTFATTTTDALVNAGISFVSLANNHTDNFGIKGFKETKQNLTRAGITYFGDPWNTGGTEATTTKNDIPIALVGYHQFQLGFEHVLADVARLSSEGYFVIVMPHWGIEYATTSDALQQKQAQQLALAGAHAIIGAHPHVIEEHEMIGDVPVFYSLGNLLFDQYFSPEVMAGNMIELTLTKQASTTKLSNIRVYNTSIASKIRTTVDTNPIDLYP